MIRKSSRGRFAPGGSHLASIAALVQWKSQPHSDVAFALAACRSKCRVDYGPELLCWYYGGDDAHAPLALSLAKIAIVRHCARAGVALTQEKLDGVATEALLRLTRGEQGFDAETRAKVVRMRAAEFRPARNAAVRQLVASLRTAREAFRAALQGPDVSTGVDQENRTEASSVTDKAA